MSMHIHERGCVTNVSNLDTFAYLLRDGVPKTENLLVDRLQVHQLHAVDNLHSKYNHVTSELRFVNVNKIYFNVINVIRLFLSINSRREDPLHSFTSVVCTPSQIIPYTCKVVKR